MLLLINAVTGSQFQKVVKRALERAHVERARAFEDAFAGTANAIRFAVSPVRTAAVRFLDWRKRVNTIRELEGLDDRTLKDIGLDRGDIHAVATALVNRKQSAPQSAASILSTLHADEDCLDPHSDCYRAA